MTTAMEITVKKAARSRISEIDFKNLEFGLHITDHMFETDYAGKEWKTFFSFSW